MYNKRSSSSTCAAKGGEGLSHTGRTHPGYNNVIGVIILIYPLLLQQWRQQQQGNEARAEVAAVLDRRLLSHVS